MSENTMKEWFLDVPWGKLAMLSWGSPSLPPVLLVHGFLDTAATFLPLVAAMPAEYHYVTFDLPGHGRSDTLTGPPMSCLHLVEAVRQIVEQLRWDSFYCIAHSMGYLIMLSWGSPSLPPVLLVHGFLDTAATFLPLVAAMPAEYHYVTFDLPGHGRSDTLTGPPMSCLHLVEAVRQIVEQLRWDSFYCIAHSMGYLISAFYNAVFPGRIRRLVSLAGAIGIQLHGLVEHPDKWFDISYASYYRHYCPPPPPVSYTYENAVKLLAAARHVSKEQAAGLATRCLEPVDDGRVRFTWDVKAKKIFVPHILEDTLYAAMSLPVSTLLVMPTEDETPATFKEYLDRMLGRLASVRFVLVDVPGEHSVHLANPEHVVPHIVRFFNEDSIKSKL